MALLTVACVVTSSNLAAADEDDLAPKDNAFSVGVTAGVFLPDANVHDFLWEGNTWQPLNPVAPAMGLRLSYEPIRYVGIEVEGEVIPIGTDTTNDSATLLGWRGQVIGQLPARLTPFVLVGAGSMGIVSGDSVLGDDNDLTEHIGAGAKFFLTSRMSVRLDGRWLFAPKFDFPNDDDNTVSHFLITTSLSWQFSGSRARIEPHNLDSDQDGVIGANDECPTKAGVAPSGCPAVADRDGDGINDPADRCPEEQENVNGVDDDDGCPEKADQDKDGLADGVDTCPAEAEDKDGFQDADGCPDTDNDNDGVADASDACAQVAGPADNQGCPDKDSDGDGLADRLDNCPAEHGSSQNQGCRSRQLVKLTLTEIKVLDNVYFATAKSTIRARSNPLLDNLAQVLNAHPEITRVYIEGHTDDKGAASYNKDLSQRRAEAVGVYIAGKGVSADRMQAIGHGEESPLADNRTSRGRSENRRVEFRIERAVAVAAP